MTPEWAKARITKLRTMLLVFRFMYYVWDESLINDAEYDKRENELKTLAAQWPDIERQARYADCCPTRTVGSSNHCDYPIDIQGLAEDLWATAASVGGYSNIQPTPLAELEKGIDDLKAALDRYASAADSQPTKLTQPTLF